MIAKNDIDKGKSFDWGLTSSDYSTYRPVYPSVFINALVGVGVGLPDQKILDLATGTGVIAIPLAKCGAKVSAIDIAENQILEAKKLAKNEQVEIDFHVGNAEQTRFPDHSFDVITAIMCWHYFKVDQIISEIKRLLLPDGLLVLCFMIYLPRESDISYQTEQLILKYNPSWSSSDFDGKIAVVPKWSEETFNLRTFHSSKHNVPFSRESWRGRIRACRGVGPSLTKDELVSFDQEHMKLLADIAPDNFSIPHLIGFHVFQPK